ncbi:MAG: type II toxin-antitoxin system HicB family antitoxin [Candidatus Zixiibacteriota bacterium]
MIYHLAINDVEPGHWVAWVTELHGCFSRGKTCDETVASAQKGIGDYFRWRRKHDSSFVIPASPVKTEIAEDIRSFDVDDYFVNALFEHDKKPLTETDLAEIEELLTYTRKDLQELIASLSEEQINRPIEREVTGSIAGVIKHIASAELWYFDRIGLSFPRDDYPENLMELLCVSREHTLKNIPILLGDGAIHERRDELWTARKVLRRTLWHEIAHTRQIERYKKTFGH